MAFERVEEISHKISYFILRRKEISVGVTVKNIFWIYYVPAINLWHVSLQIS